MKEIKKEELQEIKELLIIIDSIKGFMETGPLADKKVAGIVPEIKRLADEFTTDEKGIVIFKDAHTIDSEEFRALNLPAHAIIGTEETESMEELKPFEKNAYIINKNSTCGLFGEDMKFIKMLNMMPKLVKLIVTGCELDMCVFDFAKTTKCYLNEKNRKVDVIIPENATDTFDSEFHNREEYSGYAKKLLLQSGVKFVKKF